MTDEFCKLSIRLEAGAGSGEVVRGILEGDTMEVKRDFIAHKTNRVFVEFECNAKPSGIDN